MAVPSKKRPARLPGPIVEALDLARYRELAAAAVSALETMADQGPAVVVLNARQTIQVATRQAQSLLTAYFDRGHGRPRKLPKALVSWLAQESTGQREPYVARRPGRALTVSATQSTDYLVLLLTESRESTGLTRRETQVLELVGRGLTNVAIARSLDISPRTVEEHLGRIFVKLGASNRTDAVMRAFATRDPDQQAKGDTGTDHY